MAFLVTDTALKSEVASEHTLTSETHFTPMKITRDVLWQWQEDLRFSLSMKKANHVQDNPARSSNELSCSTYLSFISTVSALPSLPSTTIAFFPTTEASISVSAKGELALWPVALPVPRGFALFHEPKTLLLAIFLKCK